MRRELFVTGKKCQPRDVNLFGELKKKIQAGATVTLAR